MLFKSIITVLIVTMGILAWLTGWISFPGKKEDIRESIYDFQMKSIDGEVIDFRQYRDKHLLIVNTASKCGYTPQYEELQKLYERYGDKVVVLGFPANNFLWQEPGSNEEIAAFCEKNFGVTFPLFEKISVRGADQHPLYQWLEAKSGKKPTWNFCKYLVDREGKVTGFYGPKISPLDGKIITEVTR